MKQSKDPFELAIEEQEESPPDSPVADYEIESQTEAAQATVNFQGEDSNNSIDIINQSKASVASVPTPNKLPSAKNKEEEEDEDDENMEDEFGKFSAAGDPDKLAKMQAILSQFTEEQMSRYESFRRSGFNRPTMKKLLTSIAGTAKISGPMNIVVCGICKIFVGELVETARMVMTERGDTGPIRPCHIRESYRRLKLEGKIPKRSVPRLFR